MKRKFFIALLSLVCAIACAFSFAACVGNGGEVQATGIRLNRETEIVDGAPVGDCIYFTVGQSVTLTATLTPNNATSEIVWSSDKPEIASVDGNGKITARAQGRATITATVNGTSAFCFVSVSTLPATEFPEEAESFVREFIRPTVIGGTDVKSEIWSVETNSSNAISAVSILYIVSAGGTERKVELAHITLAVPVSVSDILGNAVSRSDIDCNIEKTTVFTFDAQYNYENQKLIDLLYKDLALDGQAVVSSEMRLITETTASKNIRVAFSCIGVNNSNISIYCDEIAKDDGTMETIINNLEKRYTYNSTIKNTFTMKGDVIYSQGYEYENN